MGSRALSLYLEASRAPVDKLDGLVELGRGDGKVDVLGDDVAAVEQADGHVLPLLGVALHHLAGGFEASLGDDVNAELFVISLERNWPLCVDELAANGLELLRTKEC